MNRDSKKHSRTKLEQLWDEAWARRAAESRKRLIAKHGPKPILSNHESSRHIHHVVVDRRTYNVIRRDTREMA